MPQSTPIVSESPGHLLHRGGWRQRVIVLIGGSVWCNGALSVEDERSSGVKGGRRLRDEDAFFDEPGCRTPICSVFGAEADKVYLVLSEDGRCRQRYSGISITIFPMRHPKMRTTTSYRQLVSFCKYTKRCIYIGKISKDFCYKILMPASLNQCSIPVRNIAIFYSIYFFFHPLQNTTISKKKKKDFTYLKVCPCRFVKAKHLDIFFVALLSKRIIKFIPHSQCHLFCTRISFIFVYIYFFCFSLKRLFTA